VAITALRIDPDATVEPFMLPAAQAAQRQDLRDLLGGTVDAGVYHRQALLHVHGGGPTGQDLPLNVAAWTLDSTWQGMEIYGLYGTAVVTGPNRPDGGSAALDDGLAQQVRAVCAAVRDVLIEWQTRPPAGEAAARAEVLAGFVGDG
jgi:hypothetical protein